jgi:hypothetical protein
MRFGLSHDAPDQALIFLHIGKTAGSTLGNIIDRNYPNNQLYVIAKNDDNARFAALPEAARARVQMLRGITYYGIHTHLPAPARYFTLLRDPVERVISGFFYNQRRRKRMGIEVRREIGLKQWLKLEPFQAELQLRMLVGGATIEAALTDPLPENAVEIAMQHIRQHFSLVATINEFDEALLLMQDLFGWKRIAYARRNVAPLDQRALLTDEQIAFIEEKTIVPRQLYARVQAESQALIAAQPAEFQDRLARLRQDSERYATIWNRTRWLRGTSAWRALRRRIDPVWEPWDDATE